MKILDDIQSSAEQSLRSPRFSDTISNGAIELNASVEDFVNKRQRNISLRDVYTSQLNPIKSYRTQTSLRRGERLKEIRTNFLGLSLQKASAQCGLHMVAWRRWETGSVLLKPSIAEMLCMKFAEYGVIVDYEWLMSGIGISPHKIPNPLSSDEEVLAGLIKDLKNSKLSSHSAKMVLVNAFMARAFSVLHSDLSISCIVNDRHMEPKYIKGAKVFGYWSVPSNLNGTDCIIKRQNNIIMIRRIFQTEKENQIYLSCYNTSYPPEMLDINSVQIGTIIAVTDSNNTT